MSRGFVYVMTAPGWAGVKIGRSDRAPQFRARELGSDPVYGRFGIWSVVDYREVGDARATEGALHRAFVADNETDAGSARELFRISPDAAVAALLRTAEADLVGPAPLGRLRLDRDLVAYLHALLRATGLDQFLDCQEMWTFSLYPSTAGGRLFTISIDRHEVAWAAPLRGEGRVRFMLHADILFDDAPDETLAWFDTRHGTAEQQPYASGDPRGVNLTWEGDVMAAREVFALPLVRRALIAYWYDALLGLRDRGKRSFFARFHDHNAVQELLRLASDDGDASAIPT